jgi:type II secretory ATPase GspE/PulE/Tfp pilus assembly ATPase PilB-like protein
MEAAMTGHLVFSTIHTNDAPSAVARLHEMGVPTFLISSSVECILAQRLVRRVCPECKERIEMTDEYRKFFAQYKIDTSNTTLYRGRGCEACNHLGYKGRAGIHELLVMNDDLRALLLKEIASGPIRDMARAQGMRTLLEDGLTKVTMGLSTIEEILATAQ